MTKIKEMIVEPSKIFTGSILKIKVKVIKHITYGEIKELKISKIKEYKVKQLKGE